ncbi:hypothetical protein LTR85_004267 [Meristemomyces frigidus]|nr:hypothetical protein LTR85_004267 [Meristemomyces frigidus]
MAHDSFIELVKSLSGGDMISINAGEGQEPFHIQRTLLTNSSPWFDKALSDHFNEGQDRTLRFPGTSATVVQIFIFWLFNKELPLRDILTDLCRVESRGPSESEIQTLAVRVWIFGEEHMLPRLQNQAMRELHNSLAMGFPTSETIKEAYEGSAPGSVLRRKLIREAVAGWKLAADKGNPDTIGFRSNELDHLSGVAGFLVDFATELGKYAADFRIKDPDESGAAAYYVSNEKGMT